MKYSLARGSGHRFAKLWLVDTEKPTLGRGCAWTKSYGCWAVDSEVFSGSLALKMGKAPCQNWFKWVMRAACTDLFSRLFIPSAQGPAVGLARGSGNSWRITGLTALTPTIGVLGFCSLVIESSSYLQQCSRRPDPESSWVIMIAFWARG